MKKLITLLFFLCAGTMYAQVGIGTPLPDASSQLDVVSSDKGLLIPRIPLTSSTDNTSISNGNVLSLMVFNTAIVSDITPGYHYWDGTKWQRITNADDVITLIEDNETLTSISQDIDAGTITYIDEEENSTVLDLAAMIDANETLTSLTDNNDGTLTYLDEEGNATVIDLGQIIDNFETVTNLVDNGDGTITYTNEEGTNQTIDLETIIDQFETLTVLEQDDATGDITYTDEDGNDSVADVVSDDTSNIIIVGPDGGAYMDQAIIANNETLTILELLVDGSTLQYTDEEGTQTQIDLSMVIDNFETLTVLGMNADGVNLDYQDENGDITQVDLGAVIATNETLTVLEQDDATGDITYTDEDGNDSVADVVSDDTSNIIIVGPDGGAYMDQAIIANNETLTILELLVDGSTLQYTDEEGTQTQIDLSMVIDNFETLTVLGMNADGVNLDYQDENGDITQVDLGAVIATNETLTVLDQDDATGDITYTDEDGNDSVADVVSDDASNIIIVGPDGGAFLDQAIIANNETLTILELLVDGSTLQYTDEEGTQTQIDLSMVIDNFETLTVLGMNADGVNLDYQDENGDITQVNLGSVIATNETLTVLEQDDATGDITYTDEDGNDSVADVVSDDTSNIIIVGPDGGAFLDQAIITNNETLTILELLVDGSTLQYTDEEGTQTQIDLSMVIDNFETLTVLGMNADGVNLDYQDENGDITQVNLGSVIATNETLTVLEQDDATGDITYTDEDGNDSVADVVSDDTSNIIIVGPDGGAFLDQAIIANNETLTILELLVDGSTLQYTDEEGTQTQIDLSMVIDNFETLTVLGMNADGVNLDYQDENGDITQVNLGSVIANNETVTTLMNNNDGTYTYTSEDGTITIYDVTQTDIGDPNVNGTTGTAGDVYVDEGNGDVYTHNGTTWINQAVANEPWFGTDDDMGATDNTEDIYQLGNVGIGTATPNEKLEVNGKVRISDLTGTDAATDLIVTADATTGELKSTTTSNVATTAAIRTETSNYTALADDATILADATAGAITITLPTPVLGKKYVVKKIDATVNAVTISGGGANVDGVPTRTTTNPYQSFVLQSDGANWFIIN